MSSPSLRCGMGRDRSLDEFFGGESDGSTASDGDGDRDADPSAESGGVSGEREQGIDPDDPDAAADPGADGASAPASGAERTAAESATDAGGSAATPDEGGSGDADADAPGDDRAAATPDDIEPAAVTYRWDPGGVRCAECGATVDRLWSGESGQVCVDCKEW